MSRELTPQEAAERSLIKKYRKELWNPFIAAEDGKEAVIRCGGFSFGYIQPQDSGFEWEKAIPTSEVKYRIGFNGDYLLSALQAAKVSADGSFRQPVILEFRSNIEPILLRTNKEDIKMVMPVRIKEG